MHLFSVSSYSITYLNMNSFVLSIAISFAITFGLTPIIRHLFIINHWIEDPTQKQQKTSNATAIRPVPRGGGIPIFFGIFVACILLLPFDKRLAGIIIAALFTLLVGVWDDVKDISPKLRLVTNLLAALIVVGSGIGIAYISNPFGGVIDLSFLKINFELFGSHSLWILSDLFAIIWIVWCMNIVGWSAGVEGQLPGFVSISAIFIGILGLKYSQDATQWPIIILSGAVAGSYLGFLPFNFLPQSIMPGYSGKSLAGFFLALLSILSGAKLATLLFLLAIPTLDAIFVFFKRLSLKKLPLTGGPDHLHHQLLSIGWSRRKISVFYWSISFVLGTISLFLNSQQKFYVFIGLTLIFVWFLVQVKRN